MNIAHMGRCFLPVLVLVLGCSGSGNNPSERDARGVFENKMAKEIKAGMLVVNSFSKINGKNLNVMGTAGYDVEFKADVTYPKGVATECLPEKQQGYQFNCGYLGLQGVVPKKVGQTEVITGNMYFEKTEKGWKGQDGKLY